MMGVAENISDLRDLLSIVAEETGALKIDDADEDSVGWTTEGPLPMTLGHVRRARTALAALEAALSTDAEPVAWRHRHREHQNSPWRYSREKQDLSAAKWEQEPLYTAPPAPSVAVKALHNAANDVIASASDTYKKRNGHIGSFEDESGEKCWIVPFDAFEGLRSALSAQVQDVADTDAVAALKEAEPYVEICHSLITSKDTRANVWRVLKQVRAVIASAPAAKQFTP